MFTLRRSGTEDNDSKSDLSFMPSSVPTHQRLRCRAVPPQFLPSLLALTAGVALVPPGWKTAVAISDQGAVLTDIGKEEFNAQFRICPVVRYSLKTRVHSVYVRTSSLPVGMDAYDYFTENWFSKNNVLGTDFWIYNSLNDAQAETNRWLFCNYDDPGVGYPRDCGKKHKVSHQWFAMPNSTKFPGPAQRWLLGSTFELFTGAQCPSPARRGE